MKGTDGRLITLDALCTALVVVFNGVGGAVYKFLCILLNHVIGSGLGTNSVLLSSSSLKLSSLKFYYLAYAQRYSMVFPCSSYDVFSLFDTAYTLSMGSMKRAFPIIDRDCMRSMGPRSELSLSKEKTRIVKDGCFRLSIQLSNYTIICINCEVFGSVSRRVGS